MDKIINFLEKRGVTCKQQAHAAEFGIFFVFFWLTMNMVWITVVGLLHSLGVS